MWRFIGLVWLMMLVIIPSGWAEISVEAVSVPNGSGPSALSTIRASVVSWDTNDPTPNPCYRKSGEPAKCSFITIGVNFCTIFSGGTPATCSPNIGGDFNASRKYVNNYAWIEEKKTMGELGYMFAGYGFLNVPYQITPTGNGFGWVCAYMGYLAGPMLTKLPGSQCSNVTVPPNICAIDEDTVELDYGALTPDQVDGARLSTQLHVRCNETMNIRVQGSVFGLDSIDLRADQSIKANLFINDKTLSAGDMISAGTAGTTVNISSILSATGTVTAGEFQGSAALIVSVL